MHIPQPELVTQQDRLITLTRLDGTWFRAPMAMPADDLIAGLSCVGVANFGRIAAAELASVNERIRHSGNHVALFNDTEGQRYFLFPQDMTDITGRLRASGQLKEDQTLPQFDLAVNSIENARIDARIENFKMELESAGVAVSFLGASLALAWSVLSYGINWADNVMTTAHFWEKSTPVSVAGADYRANKDSVFYGPMMRGVIWDFSRQGVVSACDLRKEPVEKLPAFFHTPFVQFGYVNTCKPLEQWPSDSPQQKQYASALQAWLQVNNPGKTVTTEQVSSIIAAQQQLKRSFGDLKPN